MVLCQMLLIVMALFILFDVESFFPFLFFYSINISEK